MSFEYSILAGAAAGTGANRRATVRYQCAPATSGRVVLAEDYEFQRAWVLDLSTGGVGLSMSRGVRAGTSLVIQLKSANRQKVYELAARVAHVTPMPTGDFRIGCEFFQSLSGDDLDALL